MYAIPGTRLSPELPYKWMNGKYARSKGADYFKDINKQTVIKDLQEFYESAEGGIFKDYLPDFLEAVAESGF
jgi:hypothetical protein